MKRFIIFAVIIFLTGCTIAPPESSNTGRPQTGTIDNTNQQEANVKAISSPLIIQGIFVGGISGGKLMKPDEFYNSKLVDFDGYVYDTYLEGKKKGEAIGSLPFDPISGEALREESYDEAYAYVELKDKNNEKASYDLAIKTDWDIFPRNYKAQSTDQENYITLAKDLLGRGGVENPDTTLKQVIRVDLEGDGTEEVLIAANNTQDDQFEEVQKGDNALIVFRKVVNGEVIDQVVDQDIRLEVEEYPSIYRILFQVDAIADLDGDGVMEVIIRSWYYEGEGWGVYKLIDNKLELVTSNGWGV